MNVATIIENGWERRDGSVSLSCADTAKLVRLALKKAFPKQKFSVRSSTYANGASIDVSWTDGPTGNQVDAIVRGFAGSRFDAMIDLKTYAEHWLEPDGSVTIAHAPGTNGSLSEIVEDPPSGSAKLVSFGADYVFSNRRLSPEFTDAMLKRFEERLGRELPRDPKQQWNHLVPLAVDRIDGQLLHMVETETEALGTVLHQYAVNRTWEDLS